MNLVDLELTTVETIALVKAIDITFEKLEPWEYEARIGHSPDDALRLQFRLFNSLRAVLQDIQPTLQAAINGDWDAARAESVASKCGHQLGATPEWDEGWFTVTSADGNSRMSVHSRIPFALCTTDLVGAVPAELHTRTVATFDEPLICTTELLGTAFPIDFADEKREHLILTAQELWMSTL